jgi:hypothetical protein
MYQKLINLKIKLIKRERGLDIIELIFIVIFSERIIYISLSNLFFENFGDILEIVVG